MTHESRASNLGSSGPKDSANCANATISPRNCSTSSGRQRATASASEASTSANLRSSMSAKRPGIPKTQLATCRRMVDIMNAVFAVPCADSRIRRSRSRTPSCKTLWSAVKSVWTVSGLRCVNAPMSRRRVRLIRVENVYSSSSCRVVLTLASSVGGPARRSRSSSTAGSGARTSLPHSVPRASFKNSLT